MSRMPARRQQPEPIDVSPFTHHVAAARRAFLADVTYAVNIARAGAAILRKRDISAARRRIREAETTAHLECRDTEPFECHAHSACGTGDCKFATTDLAALTAAGSGTRERPQRRNAGTYSIEPAVTELADRSAA